MLERTKHQVHKWKFLQHAFSRYVYDRSLLLSGADPGFFLGGGAPLGNDVTDGEVKKFQNLIRIYEEESFVSGGDAHPLHPPPRSAPDFY